MTQITSIIWALRHLWATTSRYMMVLFGVELFASFLPAAVVLVTRTLINRVAGAENLARQPLETLLTPLLLLLGLLIVQSICNSLRAFISQTFRDEVNLQISSSVMERSATQELIFFETPANQDMLSRINRTSAVNLAGTCLNSLSLLTDSIKLISLFTVVFFIEPFILVVAIPLFVPYLVFKIKLAGARYVIEKNNTTKRRWTDYFLNLMTKPRHLAEIKLLGISKYFIDSFKTLIAGFFLDDMNIRRRVLRGDILFSTLANIGISALLVRIIVRVSAGALTIGDLVVFIGTTTNLRNLLESISSTIGQLFEQAAHIDHFRHFLDSTSESKNTEPTAASLHAGTIELRDISFTYPGTTTPVLHNINLTVRPGETIALVGHNGSGKTTLAKMIAGLYEPGSGSICIDGRDVRQYPRGELSRMISYVFQDYGRFEASVQDNIALGDWDRLRTDPGQEVRAIAKKVGIDEAICAYPDGYGTQLGKLFGNHEPSGGQWQYIAIARAFARDSSLLILDEPSASLDIYMEHQLFKKFRSLAANRTTFLISHRLSSARFADRVIVLDGGTIIESGNHEELLARDGAYAAMYQLFLDQIGSGSARLSN